MAPMHALGALPPRQTASHHAFGSEPNANSHKRPHSGTLSRKSAGKLGAVVLHWMTPNFNQSHHFRRELIASVSNGRKHLLESRRRMVLQHIGREESTTVFRHTESYSIKAHRRAQIPPNLTLAHAASGSMASSLVKNETEKDGGGSVESLEQDGIEPDLFSLESRPLLSFPGGGMFFYWQIGAAAALGRRYDLRQVDLLGASAGALAATLTACQVDGRRAAEAAFQLSLDNKVWDRFGGLAGCWGGLIRQWLHGLLPPDAPSLCGDRLHLYVLELPSIRRRTLRFSRRAVHRFDSREDLVECCLASVHIPLFMDGRPWTRCRGRRAIDGSILASSSDDGVVGNGRPTIVLDYKQDEAMNVQAWRWLDLGGGPDATWQWIEEMMDSGYAHVEKLEREGSLKALNCLRL